MKPYIIKTKNSFYEEGALRTLNKIVVNRLYKHSKSYLNYLIKHKKYSQNVIFISGLPKSGTTWIGNLFASLDGFDRFIPSKWNLHRPEKWGKYSDLYPGFFDEFKNRLAVIKGHTWGSPYNVQILKDSGLKYIITVRDPRDKIISHYWYVQSRKNHWDHPLVLENPLSEFISYKLCSGEFEKESIDWLRVWLANRDKEKSIIVRYEDMISDTYVEMNKILDFLGINCRKSEVNSIIDLNSFKKISGRNLGEEDNKSFLRKGVYGEWKTIFNENQKKIFSNLGEDIIKSLGYEQTIQ